MKNTVKKICLALLCAVLLISPLASCGNKANVSNPNFSLSTLTAVDPSSVPESAKELSDVPPGTYTVLCHVPSNGLLEAVGEGGDRLSKEMYLRNSELKDKYSIELKELNITGKTVDFVRNSTLSGHVNYDIASLTFSDAMLLTISNSLCPLSEIGGFYQNRKMFSSDLFVGGKQYIEDFNIFGARIDDTYAVAVNSKIRGSLGLGDDMFSVAVQGDLTLEYMGKVAAEKGKLGFYGEGVEALWNGSGVAFYKNGFGGLPEYSRIEVGAGEAYSDLKQHYDSGFLQNRTPYEQEKVASSAEELYRDFAASAAANLFTVGTVSQIKRAIQSGLALDVLPLPKVGTASRYASLVSSEALCTVIPAGNEEKNAVAFALTGILYGYSLDAVAKEEFLSLSQREGARTGEMLDTISSSRVFDPPALYNVGGLYEYLCTSLRYNLLPDAFIEGINARAQTAVVALEIMRESGK